MVLIGENDLKLFKDEPSFLVLLRLFKSPFVLPSQDLVAVPAPNIAHRVKAGHELSVLSRP